MTDQVPSVIPQSLAGRYRPSPLLADTIRDILDPHPNVGLPRWFSSRLKAEAATQVEELAKFCDPVTEDRLRRWMQPLGVQLAGAPHPESVDYEAWVKTAMIALGSLSIGAFNAETQKEALMTLKFWPAASEIIKIITPQSGAMKAQLFAVKMIAEEKDKPPTPPYVPTPAREEAKDYVAAVVHQFVTERTFNQPRDLPSVMEVKPAPLRPGELLATWEKAAADGVPGAADRVERIKAQMVNVP